MASCNFRARRRGQAGGGEDLVGRAGDVRSHHRRGFRDPHRACYLHLCERGRDAITGETAYAIGASRCAMVDRKDIDVDETCARLRKLLAETRGLSPREFANALVRAVAADSWSVVPRRAG